MNMKNRVNNVEQYLSKIFIRHMSLDTVNLYIVHNNHVHLGIELMSFLCRHICIKRQKIIPRKLKGNILDWRLTLLLIEQIRKEKKI